MLVDPSTIKSWEENEFNPDGENNIRLVNYLDDVNKIFYKTTQPAALGIR